jgi:beta-xylosidase
MFFSSEKPHRLGLIMVSLWTQTKVPWLTNINYDMWAPDCVFKNNKYYFLFSRWRQNRCLPQPTNPKALTAFLDKPVEGIRGIDPCVLIDKDGQALYLHRNGDALVLLSSKPV